MKRMWSRNELRKIIQQTYGIYINNLIDKDVHERFIEGNITITTIEGVTQNYGKWSLSGSHLLIVVCFSVSNSTVLAAGTLAEIDLPQWIKDKIVPLYSNSIDYKSFYAFNSGGGSQSLGVILRKPSDNKIDLYNASLTLTDDRSVRIAFDLLIDND